MLLCQRLSSDIIRKIRKITDAIFVKRKTPVFKKRHHILTSFWFVTNILFLQFYNFARLSLMWNIFHTVHWRFCEAGKLDLRKLVFDLVLPSFGLQCTSPNDDVLYSQKIGNHPPPSSPARRRAVGQILKYSLLPDQTKAFHLSIFYGHVVTMRGLVLLV